MATTETKTKLDDGFEVYTKTWKATGQEKARILFLHGFTDHCNNYNDVFNHLASRGITVRGFDQRGWGKSVTTKSQRGQTGPTSRVHADISFMLRKLLSDGSTPVFILGHSMGGAESLTYSSEDPDQLLKQVRGTVASAPLIALHPSTRPFSISVLLGRLAAWVMPNFQLVNHLDKSFLSHDDKMNQAYVDDPLNHDTGTLEGMAGMLDRAADLDSGKILLQDGKHQGGQTRVVVLHGDGDQGNEFDASKRFVERIPVKDKEFFAMPGLYHNSECHQSRTRINLSLTFYHSALGTGKGRIHQQNRRLDPSTQW